MSITTARSAAVLAVGAALAFGLTACGGSSAAEDVSSAQNPPTQAAGGAAGNPFPGATGMMAAVNGKTIQVQSETTQTEVTYSGSTTITESRLVDLAAISAGDCVIANGSSTSTTSVTATSVNVDDAVDGECTSEGGDRGPGGLRGGDRPSGERTAPDGAQRPDRAQRPDGAPGEGISVASGRVVSASSSELVLEGQLNSIGSGDSEQTTGAITVVLAADATVMKQVTANSSALVVGQCARAVGDADDKGTIAATTINVSAPTEGTCNAGFGGGRRSQ